jgi:hypothetical protein
MQNTITIVIKLTNKVISDFIISEMNLFTQNDNMVIFVLLCLTSDLGWQCQANQETSQ